MLVGAVVERVVTAARCRNLRSARKQQQQQQQQQQTWVQPPHGVAVNSN
jgi:hypothetical protein